MATKKSAKGKRAPNLRAKIDALVAKAGVSSKTLEKTPGRVMSLLRGFSSNIIQRALAPHGFNQATADEGWRHLQRSLGYAPDAEAVLPDDVREAVRVLDKADEPAFRLVRAALRGKHAATLAELVKGIGPATGFASVYSMGELTSRLDALDAKKDSASKAAIEKLIVRGVTRELREEWKQHVRLAKKVKDLGDRDALLAAELARVEALIAAREYWLEWADIAATAITRRDLLIRLGLAERRSPEEQEQDEEEVEADDQGAEADEAAPAPSGDGSSDPA